MTWGVEMSPTGDLAEQGRPGCAGPSLCDSGGDCLGDSADCVSRRRAPGRQSIRAAARGQRAARRKRGADNRRGAGTRHRFVAHQHGTASRNGVGGELFVSAPAAGRGGAARCGGCRPSHGGIRQPSRKRCCRLILTSIARQSVSRRRLGFVGWSCSPLLAPMSWRAMAGH